MLEKLFSHKDGSRPDEIEAVEQHGRVQIVRFRGVLDKTTLPDSSVWGEAYLEEHHLFDKNIIVDLGKVKHVDSSALALCLLRLRQFRSHGHRLALINVPQEFLRLAEIEKVTQEVEIFDSEEAALKALGA